MRVLVVTADPSFAIGSARMHPDAKVLVASPNQLPSRAVEAFDAAVIDAGDQNVEVVERLRGELTADRLLVITEGAVPDGADAVLARPFTLEELAALLGLDAPTVDGEEDGGRFLGRLLRRFHLTADDGEDPGIEAPSRVRAWPRVDVGRDATDDESYGDAIVAGDRLRELLDGLPPVASVAEEAVALTVIASERLEATHAVVWLEVDGSFQPYRSNGAPIAPVGADHPVVSALSEDVSAVLLTPPGPAADLVGGEAPGVVLAGVRYAGRMLGIVTVGRRALTVADRDTLLEIARAHAPRLALAATMQRLRQ